LHRVSDEKPDGLRRHLGLLREDAGWCSRATNAILLCHAQFAYLMARRIDGASKSWLKGLKYGSDTTRVANDISKASRSLSQHVAQMQDNLGSFVSALENMEVRKKKPSTTAQRILGWLKYLFNALAGIFALGSFISPFLHSAGPGVGMIAPAASTLWRAAAAFCGEASGAFPRMPDSCKKEVIDSRRRSPEEERVREPRVRASIPQGDCPQRSTDRAEEISTV
jgi:hypothetical protein